MLSFEFLVPGSWENADPQELETRNQKHKPENVIWFRLCRVRSLV